MVYMYWGHGLLDKGLAFGSLVWACLEIECRVWIGEHEGRSLEGLIYLETL